MPRRPRHTMCTSLPRRWGFTGDQYIISQCAQSYGYAYNILSSLEKVLLKDEKGRENKLDN
uniref:Uncharacterized protein n=1 Tax=Nymphaea colorata TaxID=210225 RepID=A0A5K0YZZ7_9MAGN